MAQSEGTEEATATEQATTTDAKQVTAVGLHGVRFPGESAEYRAARFELLRAEMELRRKIEEVAALRRGLPLGGALKEDYLFTEGPEDLEVDMDDAAGAREVRLSELFAEGKDTLAVYSYMYGPAMKSPCPMCTSILDGLNGSAPHIKDRINLAVVAKSPLARIRAVARERGWKNLRMLSSAENTYNRDYWGETETGGQMPSLNVFVRRDGGVFHTYSSELLFGPAEAGMDQRHVDMIWPLWNMLDYTPEGRGEKWYPKLRYS
ncbi:MAG: DUF899 family protein [Acidobacteriaceae bacterium]